MKRHFANLSFALIIGVALIAVTPAKQLLLQLGWSNTLASSVATLIILAVALTLLWASTRFSPTDPNDS